MADHSTIEWTDATWNPITGCSVVSPGCTNCYAMRLAGTRLAHHPSRAGRNLITLIAPPRNLVYLAYPWELELIERAPVKPALARHPLPTTPVVSHEQPVRDTQVPGAHTNNHIYVE